MTDRVPEQGGDRITGANVLFFTMGNHFGLSQGDHNGGGDRFSEVTIHRGWTVQLY